MTEIRIQLKDEDAKRLEEEANQLQMTVVELVTERALSTRSVTRGGPVSEEFRNRILQNIKEDEELLRRLA